MAGLADAIANSAIDWINATGTPTRPAGAFLALFTVNPNFATGSGGTEATGGGYARKAITFGAAAARQAANSAQLEFTLGTDIAAGTYTGYAIYSAASGGSYIQGAAFSASRALSVTGDKIQFAAGSVVLALP